MLINATHPDPASLLCAPLKIDLLEGGGTQVSAGCLSREGYMLLTTRWNAPAEWLGACSVSLTVSQHHREWQSTHVLHNASSELVGVEFYTDGTPWTLAISVSGVEGAQAGIIHFDKMQMHIAVVDVTEIPKAFDFSSLTQPANNVPVALINANQGGLMNRLVSLLSVIETATRLGCPARCWWAPNAHCAANFDDLFDVKSSGIICNYEQQVLPSFSFYYNYNPGEPPLRLNDRPTNYIIHSTAPLRTSVLQPTSWQAVGDTFRRLKLSAPIRRKLKSFDDRDFSRTIGFHIRRPYPNGAFAEQEREKFKLGEAVFVNLLTRLRAQSPEFNQVLLCTNDPSMEERMSNLFPGYVFSFAKESIDNTTDPLAVQEALVDVMLLARCPVLFSQSNSSFAVVASAIGRSRLFCLTPQTNELSYDIMRFDIGQHLENMTIPVEEFDLIAEQARLWMMTYVSPGPN